ncbi:MAG: pyridoxal phosphate-dependent aminotransferase [Acidimicrobiales bacterium]|jgi:succinyldiaminopimelate transaminase|nr:pyridoxal phosphate-dependent aminotransferase [Acidimicrobiales bacterium]HJO78973.1 pyridoxal phosphate-dependent aminotransferase [Acidimicrobiales bacterium]|tara:strand:+ start:1225 stop:2334 length:1110 start_codon:yes stop_codon:yes gene_type:complete
MTIGFHPPPYPFERIDDLRKMAASQPSGLVDLSIGNPCDPVPEVVATALAEPDPARTYPPSIGSSDLRQAVVGWVERSFGVGLNPAETGVCIGTKELVTGLPHLLKLRTPGRDTILYPAVSYPSYAMGAELAGCRAVAVPVDGKWCLDLSAIDESDAERALALWVNTPGNPAGGLDDLEAAASWGRSYDVMVLSDECYAEFTWEGPPRSVLQHGSKGVLAVHSLSKRSNLAGLRVGYYAGDPDLVLYLQEVRKHQGFMVSGPAQVAAVAALSDQSHVDVQRDRYRRRLESLVEVMAAMNVAVSMPDGAFYLWAPAPAGDAWGFARVLADELGMVVSPGELFGEAGAGHVRLAAVASDEHIDLLRERARI